MTFLGYHRRTWIGIISFLGIVSIVLLNSFYGGDSVEPSNCLNWTTETVRDTCSEWENGECQVWKETENRVCQKWVGDNYDNVQKAESVDLPEDDKQLYSPLTTTETEGIPLASVEDAEFTCLESQQGHCVLKQEDGQKYAYVGDLEDAPETKQQLGIFGSIGDAVGGFFGGGSESSSSDESDDVDVSVSDETTVEYSDGSSETYDSSDDDDGDGYVEVDDSGSSGGTTDDDDDDDGGGCWTSLICNDDDEDEEEEDEPEVISETRVCKGQKFNNGDITGYERVAEKTEWSDGETEVETITNCIQQNSWDASEKPELCRTPTGKTTGCYKTQREIDIISTLGDLGLIK